MEHTQRIYWSDLSYDKQEEIKEDLTQGFKNDPEFMKEIKEQAENKIREDEEEPTEKNLEYQIDNLIEKKVEDIINQTFFGQIIMEY